MINQTTDNLITISKKSIQRKGGMVVLPLDEYNKLRERAVPVCYLKGKQAQVLDRQVNQGLKDYKVGKCKKIKQPSVFMTIHDKGLPYPTCYNRKPTQPEYLFFQPLWLHIG